MEVLTTSGHTWPNHMHISGVDVSRSGAVSPAAPIIQFMSCRWKSPAKHSCYDSFTHYQISSVFSGDTFCRS